MDKDGTALDRLAKGVAKYHDNLDYKVLAVHPKRPDIEQLAAFEREIIDADIIDWQYYRTAEKLRSLYPILKEKKQILTHNNPYSIEEGDWNGYDMVVANNETIYKRLGQITNAPLHYIPITLDTDFWTFNTDWTPVNPNKNNDPGTVIMVANRIESKKGILPIAIACADLGIKFILVGAISDLNYFHAIQATGNVEFYEQITDQELKDLYYRSTIHICNSVDGFESGTMPIIEAMLCGTPVITRSIGHVPDLYNGENMVIFDSHPEDVEKWKQVIFDTISDKKLLYSLHDKGWNTAKSRSFERRAYMYQKLYREVMWPTERSVSVVIPVHDKPDIIRKCLNAAAEQTYKNIELIICDDSGQNKAIVDEIGRFVNIPFRYIDTSNGDYGLARSRNIGTIYATGEVIVYCDQRMIMQPDAITEFVEHLAPRLWLFGNKGGKKDTFVENFSCIYRDDIIHAGMFSERMDRYGGLSQELRERMRMQGIKTEYIISAKAIPTGKSSNKSRKKQDIIAMKNRLFKMGM